MVFMKKSEFLQDFFSVLNDSLDYFVYGYYKNLPQDTGMSDIDIIIDPSCEKKFLKLFKDFMTNHSAFVASHFGRHLYRIINNNPKEPWGVQIDVFCQGFCHHEVEYFPRSYVKESIIEYNGIKVLDEKRGYYVDFLKEIIHGVKVKQKYINAFSELIEGNKAKYLAELEFLYGKRFRSMVETGLAARNYNCEALKKEMRKAVHHRTLFKDINSILHRILRFFNPSLGYVIAVLGTDGSGKSAVIEAVTPWLNEAFHNGIRYNHLRPNLLKPLGVVTGRRKDEPISVVPNPHAKKAAGFFVSLIKWFYNLTDYTFGYLVKVWTRISTKSEVFLFDRYYYDYYIDQKRFGIHLPKWLIRVGDFFVPKPDLIICLGGNPEIIYERKPETSLEEVRRQINELRHFAQKHKNAVMIDTTIPFEKTIVEVRKAIIQTMSTRFSKM